MTRDSGSVTRFGSLLCTMMAADDPAAFVQQGNHPALNWVWMLVCKIWRKSLLLSLIGKVWSLTKDLKKGPLFRTRSLGPELWSQNLVLWGPCPNRRFLSLSSHFWLPNWERRPGVRKEHDVETEEVA